MLIVKKSDSYCLQLSDTETSDNEKNDVISKKLHFHFLGDRPTQNLTGWKRWVLVEKLISFGEVLRLKK